MQVTASDAVMTPDLRFAAMGAGPLDLRLRVGRNGDTCVESRGAGAPTLTVAEQFSDATYQVRAGQHVLFEHGSVREVVDHERAGCGCPEAGGSVAEALLAHPFPEALSAGLVPESAAAAVPQAAPGEVHTQVSDALSYNAAVATASAAVAVPETGVPAPAAAPPAKDLVHVVGRFFRRVFRRG
jgi:hypothetical protein